jgi:molybdopterin-guanine dinucleotide biosynthesis protein A
LKIDHVEGAILVGGASSRMGRDKARLEWHGVPLVRRVADALGSCLTQVRLVTRPGAEPPLDLPCIEDSETDRAPIVGIHAALRACGRAAVLVAACDLPEIDPRFVLALLALVPVDGDFDVVAPQRGQHLEPLLAVYRPRILPEVERRIRAGELGLQKLLRSVMTLRVPEEELRSIDPELRSLRNVNQPSDLS